MRYPFSFPFTSSGQQAINDTQSLPYLDPKKTRCPAIITAGNSELGFHLACHLYLHGYIVYVGGRSKTRCQGTIEKVISKTQATIAKYTTQEAQARLVGEMRPLELDLSSLKSVQSAALEFKNQEKTLALLIHNAGLSVLPNRYTSEVLDLQLQTNFMAPFLLTMELIPPLEATANSDNLNIVPRVVYVTSVTHHLIFRYILLTSRFGFLPNFMYMWLMYAIANTAGIHFTKMLALRNPRLLCVSVQPGIITNSEHFAYWTRLPLIGSLFWCLFHIFAWLFGVSAQQGADTILHYSIDPSLRLLEDNGRYFTVNGEAQPSKVASNMDYAAQSWIWASEQLKRVSGDLS